MIAVLMPITCPARSISQRAWIAYVDLPHPFDPSAESNGSVPPMPLPSFAPTVSAVDLWWSRPKRASDIPAVPNRRLVRHPRNRVRGRKFLLSIVFFLTMPQWVRWIRPPLSSAMGLEVPLPEWDVDIFYRARLCDCWAVTISLVRRRSRLKRGCVLCVVVRALWPSKKRPKKPDGTVAIALPSALPPRWRRWLFRVPGFASQNLKESRCSLMVASSHVSRDRKRAHRHSCTVALRWSSWCAVPCLELVRWRPFRRSRSTPEGG